MDKFFHNGRIFFAILLFVAVFYLIFINITWNNSLDADPSSVTSSKPTTESSDSTDTESDDEELVVEEERFIATHVPTPKQVKAIYMTSWVAGTPSIRSGLVHLIETTEANSVVIDIKEETGRITFEVLDPELKAVGSEEVRITDFREFIATLHEKGIYVIGRISVFQDPYFARARPHVAVLRESDGAVWKDRKGISWVDPGSKEVWDYIVKVATESYEAGVDELNFDYIRFPSDGNMRDIAYPASAGRVKAEVLEEFFAYLNEKLHGMGAVTSADLFGMTTTNNDDLGIGQVLEAALPYFDHIAPMTYPSHYPPTWNGYANPSVHPYEVLHFSLGRAVERAVATSSPVKTLNSVAISTTTPIMYSKPSFEATKIRPWIQDFDLGADYTAEMVRLQIKATYDVGLTSWMIWAPSNKYTPGALKAE